MLQESEFYCPECDDGLDTPTSRRQFLTAMGAGTAALAGGLVGSAQAAQSASTQPASPAKDPSPAEQLVRELYQGLNEEQRRNLVYPYDHQSGGRPTRHATFNSAILGKRLADHLTRPQQDLVRRILRSILSSDDALARLSRNNSWDGSRSFEGNGCAIFGTPGDNSRFAWVFSGHHLTLRCDGNSEPGAAFGGPVYYGHSADGYSQRNVYYYQTREVEAVYEALTEAQRRQAVAQRNPGDREAGIRFPDGNAARPGIAYADLTQEQKKLLEGVLRTLLEPFRREDADEVLQIVRVNGGMERVHLAFYREGPMNDKTRWNYWRLEGPKFIWNYRVLPHVHCYVNITTA